MRRAYKHIGIVKHPAIQLTALYGLTDMLETANNYIAQLTDKSVPLFAVSHWHLNNQNDQLEVEYCTEGTATALQQTAIILPGTTDTDELNNISPVIIDWIKQQYTSGAITCSVCKGAFILAKCGILNNRAATTHWAFEAAFTANYPQVILKTDQIIVDEGDIITAGGVMAWLDLGLRLIHRFAGAEVMAAVAKFMLVDPSGREQKFYRAFVPLLDHGDATIIRIQHWLQVNYAQPLSLEMLAQIAAVSIRTLIRRFNTALDMSPTAYIQQVRIGKARELLEFGTLPVSQIAWEVGYEDPGSFRKIFQRQLGLTPAEYRRRFHARP